MRPDGQEPEPAGPGPATNVQPGPTTSRKSTPRDGIEGRDVEFRGVPGTLYLSLALAAAYPQGKALEGFSGSVEQALADWQRQVRPARQPDQAADIQGAAVFHQEALWTGN